MSTTSPFHTYAGLLDRHTHLIHTYLRNDPGVVGYQYWGHTTINDAYGNPLNSGVGGAGSEAMFQVQRGGSYRSPTLRKKGLGLVAESRRGTTHALFDIDDFITVGGAFSKDEDWMFLRVQENRATAGLLDYAGVPADPVLGPIYCIPPTVFFGQPKPAFTLMAQAPSSTGSTMGAVPVCNEDLANAGPRPLHIVFTRPLEAVWVHNTSVVNLLVSFGPGQMMLEIAAGDEMSTFSGSLKEIIFACPDGVAGASFTLNGIMTLG